MLCLDVICCPICCPLKTCYYICCFVTVSILITIGVLVAFLVQMPSASVSSVTLQCGSQPQCLALASTSGVPVAAVITVHNPNIASGSCYSDDLVVRDPSNSDALLGTGYFNSTHIGSRTDSDITAYLTFLSSPETQAVLTRLYTGQPVSVDVSGDVHISVAAISFTKTIDETGTIPAQS